MLGPSHLLFGAATYTAVGVLYQHAPLTQVIIGAVAATATSSGVLSPDMDQRAPFEWARTILGPASKLLAHRRGITHWWAIPVIAWVWWLPTIIPSAQWAATALIIGWASHIIGDGIFGRIPLLPGWGPMYGLSIRTGQWVEEGPSWCPVSPLRTVLVVALAWLLWIGVQSAA